MKKKLQEKSQMGNLDTNNTVCGGWGTSLNSLSSRIYVIEESVVLKLTSRIFAI